MYPIGRNMSNVNFSQFHDWNKLILTSSKRDILKLYWGSSIIKNPNLNTLEFCLGLPESIAWVQTPLPKGERDLFFKRGQESAVHRLGPTGHGFFLLSVTENNVLRRILQCSSLCVGTLRDDNKNGCVADYSRVSSLKMLLIGPVLNRLAYLCVVQEIIAISINWLNSYLLKQGFDERLTLQTTEISPENWNPKRSLKITPPHFVHQCIVRI